MDHLSFEQQHSLPSFNLKVQRSVSYKCLICFPPLGQPIFSIDVDATGQRICTCGQDNKTRIWSTGPILNGSQEEEPGRPRVLATLTDHFAGVNIARLDKIQNQALVPSLGFQIPSVSWTMCLHICLQGSAPKHSNGYDLPPLYMDKTRLLLILLFQPSSLLPITLSQVFQVREASCFWF